jgi:hypothetical protein
LARDMGFLDTDSAQLLLDLATETAKLINGLLGVLEP